MEVSKLTNEQIDLLLKSIECKANQLKYFLDKGKSKYPESNKKQLVKLRELYQVLREAQGFERYNKPTQRS